MRTYGPYTPIYQAGNFYFISGQLGIDPSTRQVTGNIQEQTEQTIKNLQNLLATVNLQLDSVVKTTIFLKNINDYEAVNKIYIKYFKVPRPARSCVEVSALPKVSDKALLIELEAVAAKEHTA